MIKKKNKIRKHEPYVNLKTLLFVNKKTYAQAATVLGITPTSFNDKINGISDFSIQEILDLANAYDFDPTIIFRNELSFATPSA